MAKLFIRGSVMVLLFVMSWLTLSKVDWITILRIEKLNRSVEQKLGSLIWELVRNSDQEIQRKKITSTIDSLLMRICSANHLDHNSIRIHVIGNPEINAFALPDRRVVLFSGLIADCENEAELCGVICHELAHIELDHVMKKLVKEIGLSVLISITTGNTSGEIVKETARILSSTAYDRNLEREADLKAAYYLDHARIDPRSFANFLARLSQNRSQPGIQLAWLSTHPDSKERSEYILEYSRALRYDFEPVLKGDSWSRFRKSLDGI
jgi:predicted Zn-dependent protease